MRWVLKRELAPRSRRFMHERLGLEPGLDLGLRMGEGTGAAVAMEILDAATRVLY